MVFKHVFCFDVPAEKMTVFIKWCTDTSKSFFEKYSEIMSYDVYQTIAGKATFIKETVYKDMKAFCNIQGKLGVPKVQKVLSEFFSCLVNLATRLIMEYLAPKSIFLAASYALENQHF